MVAVRAADIARASSCWVGPRPWGSRCPNGWAPTEHGWRAAPPGRQGGLPTKRLSGEA